MLQTTLVDVERRFGAMSDETGSDPQPRFMGVVTHAKHANLIQKAVKTYREKTTITKTGTAVDSKSKACVIL